MARRKRRNNFEILESLVNESAKRIEDMNLSDLDINEQERLNDLIWNATNVTGSLQNMIDEIEGRED